MDLTSRLAEDFAEYTAQKPSFYRFVTQGPDAPPRWQQARTNGIVIGQIHRRNDGVYLLNIAGSSKEILTIDVLPGRLLSEWNSSEDISRTDFKKAFKAKYAGVVTEDLRFLFRSILEIHKGDAKLLHRELEFTSDNLQSKRKASEELVPQSPGPRGQYRSPYEAMEIKTPPPVDILSLGFGWIGTFLRAELEAQKLSYYGTSRDGSNHTIPFTFDPNSTDARQYAGLPLARTIIIIFPVIISGAHEKLIKLYNQTHSEARKQTRWIQLGSTSAFDDAKDLGESQASPPLWRDRHSRVDVSKPRVKTEEELLALLSSSACILSLAGLWGGARDMRQYVNRVAPSKAVLATKGSLHMIHGLDVARCIAAVHGYFVPGRWLLTDLRVYDWWNLVSTWGARGEGTATKEHVDWVRELLRERGVKALPRSPVQMGGKALDSREFWELHKGLSGPLKAGLGQE